MPGTDFLPDRENDLLAWSIPFNQKINATPTAYGITALQASAYGTLHTTFAAKLALVEDQLTRSPANIVAKNMAKSNLIENARLLAREIQGTPTVTDFQKADLGLTVRDPEPTPVPVPAVAPTVSIESLAGRTAKVRLRDAQNPDRRGKPKGISGATIFYYVGEVAPFQPEEWSFLEQTTRTLVNVNFPTTIEPGSRVWLTAFWYNTKAQTSPGAVAVSIRIGDELAEAA